MFVTRGPDGSQRHRFLGEEGLLVMLYRFAYPGRNSDLAADAGRWPSETSDCFAYMTEHIFNTFDYLRDWRSLAAYVDLFPEFAQVIYDRGSPLRHIIGFIDGTTQHVARPGPPPPTTTTHTHTHTHATCLKALGPLPETSLVSSIRSYTYVRAPRWCPLVALAAPSRLTPWSGQGLSSMI